MNSVTIWRLAVDLADAIAVDAVAAALAEQCEAVTAFEQGSGWQVEGWSRAKPNRALIQAALALALPEATPNVALEAVPPRDWVGDNQAGFPPLRASGFFIFGSHYRGPVPNDATAILIDAATAFGSGEHATTRGCLAALDKILKKRRRNYPSPLEEEGTRPRILDMGCGTGILAIAAAKHWRRPVLACDIDPEAVRVTTINARRNGVGGLVRAKIARTSRAHEIARRAPFDLIFANILARPLMDMAAGLAGVLAGGGHAILSGLLARQEAAVLAAYRAQGLYLRHRIPLEGWHTLVVAHDAAIRWGTKCPDSRR